MSISSSNKDSLQTKLTVWRLLFPNKIKVFLDEKRASPSIIWFWEQFSGCLSTSLSLNVLEIIFIGRPSWDTTVAIRYRFYRAALLGHHRGYTVSLDKMASYSQGS